MVAMCPTTVAGAFTCSNGKGSWRFRASRRQTSTSITLDHAHFLVNVLSSIITDSNVNGHVLLPALIIET